MSLEPCGPSSCGIQKTFTPNVLTIGLPPAAPQASSATRGTIRTACAVLGMQPWPFSFSSFSSPTVLAEDDELRFWHAELEHFTFYKVGGKT
jgi:hypothetical protein